MIRRFSFGIAVLILASTAFTPAFSQPQPRFVSGKLQDGSVVQIFGTGFGVRPAADQALQGVVLADAPRWDDCDFRRPLQVEQWEDDAIQFLFVEEGLREQQEFFLYVADSDGQVSAAIGPWMLGMGIVSETSNRIPLEYDGEGWVPGGDLPGPPRNMGWVNTDGNPPEATTPNPRQVSFAISEGESLLAKYSADGAVTGMPTVWMGNQPKFDECTWLEAIQIVEVRPGEIICSFQSDAADPEQTVFFFVETEPGIKNEGLMVQATVLGPGPPQQLQLR